MKTFCTLTKTTYNKKPNTKTVFVETETVTEVLTEQQYNNHTKKETLKFFRSLGGTETAVKSYTERGYLTTKLTSICPFKHTKIIYQFSNF